ncbi:MAG: oligosaccharide flippase family protein [Flavobacterium sp.]|nr:oligosaccharide flippase family protein [Flavobacterium sp.]
MKIKEAIFSLNPNQLKNFSIYGFGQFINLISPLLVTPYLIHVCGLQNFGKIGLGISIAFFLILIVDYGTDITGVKNISINRENNEVIGKLFTSIFVTKLILFLLVLFFSTILFFTIPFFNKEKTLLFLSLMIVLGQLLNPTWFLQGTENYKSIALLNSLSKIIYLLTVFLFVKKEGDYIFANFCLGLGTLIAGGIAFVWIFKKYNFSFKSVNKKEIINLLKEDFSLCISQLFLSLKLTAPIVILSYFGGYLLAGQFKIMEQIISLFRTYLQTYSRFFYPKLCFKIFNDVKQGIHFWKKIYAIDGLFLVFLLSVMFVYTKEVLAYFKVENEMISDLIPAFRLSLVIPLLIAVSQPLEQLLFSLNKNAVYVKLTITATVVGVLCLVIFTPSFQLMGALVILILTELLLALFYYLSLKNYFVNRPI